MGKPRKQKIWFEKEISDQSYEGGSPSTYDKPVETKTSKVLS